MLAYLQYFYADTFLEILTLRSVIVFVMNSARELDATPGYNI
ncbi:MAG TPA: hypothetical protein VET51_03010 [Burkholderiales bacterium]|nr:hypothetical protein [Burkholderiales bacterium]